MARYDHAGYPRTARSVQRYCAKGQLDCRRMEAPFGEKCLISPASVAKHIAYIEEVRPSTTGPDLRRPAATHVAAEQHDEEEQQPTATDRDVPRPVAVIPDLSERYIGRLEGEVTFLREEISTKNAQIKELTERSRETNPLIGGLQRLLAPHRGEPRRQYGPGRYMHPADIFEAFRHLVEDEGSTPDSIGLRFGYAVSTVRGFLKLANVSPRLMKAVRKDEMTLDQMQVLAITGARRRPSTIPLNICAIPGPCGAWSWRVASRQVRPLRHIEGL